MRETALYSKNGLVVTKIARELLTCEVGERIPRVQDFVARCEVGRGTIQSALQLLIESNAIDVESRGHLGSFLLKADLAELWEFAGHTNIMGAMPLPYSRRNEGLATGLYTAFERINIPFHLSYMRGATNRVKALIEGRYDVIVLSKRAADFAVSEHDVVILHKFGAETYVGAHGLLLGDPSVTTVVPGMRIGVDSSSTDQCTLTYELCRDVEVDYVELPYMQIMEQLIQGNIDAAVWNVDEVQQRFDQRGPIHIIPLNVDEQDATEAVLLVRQEDFAIYQNVLKMVDMKQVVEIQSNVLKGLHVPRY